MVQKKFTVTKPSQQYLKSIHILQLKSLKDVEINFEGSELTAIMGVNGSGKSTIIHALACCYKPLNSDQKNWKFSEFFIPTTYSQWQGSEFSIKYDYRIGSKEYNDVFTIYKKTSDRWSPKYDRRPSRNIIYIGIDTCVPKIEREKKQSRIEFASTLALKDDISILVKENAGKVMNREYSSYNEIQTKRSRYIGVEHKLDKYSDLSMGAGEQRIFYILSEVFRSPKYSLILIDEIDLLLHTDALKRLLKVIKRRAVDKSLQVVFTTHAQSVTNMDSFINIRHICQTPSKSLCFNETKPDAIFRLTGETNRPLEIFVEDDFAKAIVDWICLESGYSILVSVKEYGACINSFTLIAGILLKGESIENTIIILDGDVYKSDNEKKEKINQVLTGNTRQAEQMRNQAMRQLIQFNLPQGFNPEKYVVELIKTLPDENGNVIKQAALEIECVEDKHNFVDSLVDRLGYSDRRCVGLTSIVDLAAKSSSWNKFIAPIKDWLLLHESLKEVAASKKES
ncbi:atpase aaa-type core [Lucifera butyrica]|uniref:Atpase aaa-type core n=1 Tax=Lucifera butyrica TaxID=1351585 RepID=A0A498R907_9FIRM|nr:AAA family ATPase [Lucifera butyrica]VBB05618.1 atpase aaa-type core [Lucifera butyrica]